MELGRINPVKIPADQVADKKPETGKDPETDKNKKTKVNLGWIAPIFVFAVFIGLFIDHKITLNTALFFFIAFILIYAASVPLAIRIARKGKGKDAFRILLRAFIPLIGSANIMVYTILKSELFSHYFDSAQQGSEAFKLFLVTLSPKYGAIVYMGLLGIIVFGLNFMLIRKFSALARAVGNIAAHNAAEVAHSRENK